MHDARKRESDFGVIDASSLEGRPVPEREWLVPDLVPRNSVVMLSGDGGVGKSLLAMQLMTAAALGGKWIGLPVPLCKSLALFCEDDADELHRRQAAINEHMGCSFADFESRMLWMSRIGQENILVQYAKDSHTPPTVKPLFHQIERMVRERGIEIVVLDTVADTFGGNENFRNEVRSFISILRGLASINNGAVILTAHPSVAGQASGTGLSGSTAWNNSVRSRFYLTRPRGDDAEDSDARELKGMKANYSETGGVIRLRWERGVFVRDDSGTGMLAVIEERNQAKRFAELVAIATARGIYLSPNPSAAFAPNVLCRLPEAKGMTKPGLTKALHRAMADGLVKVIQEGRASKERSRLVAAEAAK